MTAFADAQQIVVEAIGFHIGETQEFALGTSPTGQEFASGNGVFFGRTTTGIGREPGRHFIAWRRFARSGALLDSNAEIFPKFDGRCNIFYAPIGRSIVQYDAPQVGDHQQIVGAYRPFTGRGL